MIPELAAKTVLFQGCSPQEVEQLYRCLQMTDRDYTRGTPVLLSGSPVTDIGIVLSGSVRIESGDVWGGVSVLGMVEPGGVFAEAYACLPGEPLLVDVIANTDCRVLFLNVPRLLQPCGQACGCHNQVIRNLVMASARKNLHLSQRIFHTAPKTIRGRLLSYLSQQAALQGGSRVTIPFDRQQLADYLSVDRSALSKELGKMQREGLLEFRKNVFILKV